MSPDIARQFRGLEDFLESQQRAERISFLGSDISPTIDVDPGTLRINEAVEEFSTITGPVTVHTFAAPPAGFFKIYLLTTLTHTDPVARNSTLRVESLASGNFLIIQNNQALGQAVPFPNGRQIIIPGPGFRLGAEVIGLAGPAISNFISMAVTLPLGAAIPPGP